MMYKDLYYAGVGTIHQRTQHRARATVGFFWANTRPSEVSINVRAGETHEVWSVGRNLFVAAGLDWYRGAWTGGGDFGFCYAGERAMLAFKPTHLPKSHHAIVIVPAAPLEDFIRHTCALVEPGEAESLINMESLDKALDRILGSDRG